MQVLALTLFLTASAGASFLTASAGASAVRLPTDLRHAVDSYEVAQSHARRGDLQRLLASDYVLVNSSGARENKQEFIAELCNPQYKLEPYTILEPVARVWATGAVVGGVTTLRGVDHGKLFSVKIRFADIWAKRNGRWQVIFTQVGRA